jgi:hypothetical protein
LRSAAAGLERSAAHPASGISQTKMSSRSDGHLGYGNESEVTLVI